MHFRGLGSRQRGMGRGRADQMAWVIQVSTELVDINQPISNSLVDIY